MKKIFIIILSIFFLSCCKQAGESAKVLERNDWAPDVKANVNTFLQTYGGTENAYAVFDFDNTSCIFDVEEQLIIHQIETMSFEMNPQELASAISGGVVGVYPSAQDWVSDICDAYSYLYDKYGPFTANGLDEENQKAVHADKYWLEFASKMCCLYENVEERCSPDVSYEWVLHWFAGMTSQQVYDLALASHKKYAKVETTKETWSGPSDLDTRIGPVSYEWINGVRVTENIQELWKALKANGIDVWVCSASGIDQVIAAVDAFDLHESCTGVLAMTLKKDKDGKLLPEYDYENGCGMIATGSGWEKDTRPTCVQTSAHGKVSAILNAIAPRYGGQGPIAGFMDSTGDFNFCTEFSSLKMVICFNRASRKITDGGGVISELAIHQRDNLGYDLLKANANSDTMYLLQGRDERGLRSFRASNATIRIGSDKELLFADSDNEAQLLEMKQNNMSTKEALDKFGKVVQSDYEGYHCR